MSDQTSPRGSAWWPFPQTLPRKTTMRDLYCLGDSEDEGGAKAPRYPFRLKSTGVEQVTNSPPQSIPVENKTKAKHHLRNKSHGRNHTQKENKNNGSTDMSDYHTVTDIDLRLHEIEKEEISHHERRQKILKKREVQDAAEKRRRDEEDNSWAVKEAELEEEETALRRERKRLRRSSLSLAGGPGRPEHSLLQPRNFAKSTPTINSADPLPSYVSSLTALPEPVQVPKRQYNKTDKWIIRHGPADGCDDIGRPLWRKDDGTMVSIRCPVAGCPGQYRLFKTLHGIITHITREHPNIKVKGRNSVLELCGEVADLSTVGKPSEGQPPIEGQSSGNNCGLPTLGTDKFAVMNPRRKPSLEGPSIHEAGVGNEAEDAPMSGIETTSDVSVSQNDDRSRRAMSTFKKEPEAVPAGARDKETTSPESFSHGMETYEEVDESDLRALLEALDKDDQAAPPDHQIDTASHNVGGREGPMTHLEKFPNQHVRPSHDTEPKIKEEPLTPAAFPSIVENEPPSNNADKNEHEYLDRNPAWTVDSLFGSASEFDAVANESFITGRNVHTTASAQAPTVEPRDADAASAKFEAVAKAEAQAKARAHANAQDEYIRQLLGGMNEKNLGTML